MHGIDLGNGKNPCIPSEVLEVKRKVRHHAIYILVHRAKRLVSSLVIGLFFVEWRKTVRSSGTSLALPMRQSHLSMPSFRSEDPSCSMYAERHNKGVWRDRALQERQTWEMALLYLSTRNGSSEDGKPRRKIEDNTS